MTAAGPAATREQIEADWLRQASVRGFAAGAVGGKLTAELDAAGGCDGVKNGKWGFHTEMQADPWWQVDLGAVTALGEVRLFNRCDETAGRNASILVLLSDDGSAWRRAYQHEGKTFHGVAGGPPLSVRLDGARARYVRLQLPGTSYFHLDEVEVYPPDGTTNLALGKPATQSSLSQWSAVHAVVAGAGGYDTNRVIERGVRLAASLARLGANVEKGERKLAALKSRLAAAGPAMSEQDARSLFLEAHWAVRELAFSNPLFDFDRVLFVKRATSMLPHMSDQYYGWWSRPGGGVCVLEGLRQGEPRVRCLTSDWPAGSFIRPELSSDGRRALFAYARYHPEVAGMPKTDKARLPEDAFFHLFEMDLQTGRHRQLTSGRYDDFDARYLPDGRIVFLSTRKGQFLQCSPQRAETFLASALPDSFVRCGGDDTRPCAVFTLHTIRPDGKEIRPISAFENFEWTPIVAADGRILYARWDYIDRFNGPFMSLWSTNPDGTNAQLVYGNYTKSPHCIFEARPIPGSHKLVFTTSSHHSVNGGALALLDRTRGSEGEASLTRLTPEVCYPEAEGWPTNYYENPYPLSEEFFLTAWSDRPLPPHGGSRPITDDSNPVNASGIYLYDAFGNLELLHRDPAISSVSPIPLRPMPPPPALPDHVRPSGPLTGSFLVQDVYQGLTGVPRGSVKRLRVIGVPPKVQPHMHVPPLGISREEPGKYVLGTVPVAEDGSAHFAVPSGVPVMFQALDAEGLAVQTMRTLTYVQAGQTLSCIGCHESREAAPRVGRMPLAAAHAPAKITPGPEGSWPLRFDRLVQPVLDRHCVRCHSPEGEEADAVRFDLTAAKAYDTLTHYAGGDLNKLSLERDASLVDQCVAKNSKLLAYLTRGEGHRGVRLEGDSLDRLVTWMDLYSPIRGSFSEEQEQWLDRVRQEWRGLLASGGAAASAERPH